MSPAPDEDPELLDLFVVGGGPHGRSSPDDPFLSEPELITLAALATISRLYEPTPNALYSEVEHARLHWIRKHRSNKTVSREVEEGRAQPAKGPVAKGRFQLDKGPRVVVMDKQRAGWLGTWDTLFVRMSFFLCGSSTDRARSSQRFCRTPLASRPCAARCSSIRIQATSTPSSRTPTATAGPTSSSRSAVSLDASGPSTKRRGAGFAFFRP